MGCKFQPLADSSMQIHVTFRHIESSDALREYAESKFSKLEKFLHEPIEIHIVLEVQKKIHHLAEITIHAKSFHFHTVEESKNLYASIDVVFDKVERHLAKHKERIKDHHATPTQDAAVLLNES